MSSQSRATEVAESLRRLTAFERGVARNRLIKYFDGKMPRWTKQVQMTGVISAGYLLLAAVLCVYSSVFVIFGCILVYVEHKSSGLIDLEIIFFAFGGLLMVWGLTRWAQGMLVGRKYRDTHFKDE